MIKKFRVAFFVIVFASLLFGCQIKAPEQATILANDVIEASDSVEVEETQVEEVQTEEIQPEEIRTEESQEEVQIEDEEPALAIHEDGSYTSKDDVALYIHTYNRLPSNYITKKEAQERGWNSKENTVAKVLPGKSIGGDHFGNYEGILPKAEGRSYKECDIDYVSGSRNAKRIVFSNDGLVFYTEDHYSTFEQLY